MCGIVGIASPDKNAQIGSLLSRMNDVIVYRGPDDSGEYIAPDLGLAMRRLSIIDLASGHQPMRTDDGVTLVFNGEIYNYVALRDDLIARGYCFKTKSDTEVILNLYHAEGCEGFKKLNGMFAVAIHDSRSDELVLVRDQVGIKPLYYLLDSTGFLFGSEIKSILAALPSKPAVNPQAVWDFLSLRYVPPPTTIWQGILKLAPGHVLRYSLKTRRAVIDCFWRPNLTPEPFEPGRNYLAEFEERFLAAVQSHIAASDVPVGTFLSGGLDSGAICAASFELGHRDFHTFSIGGEDGGKDDELPLARIVSTKFGTTHHEITMTRALYFDRLDSVAWHFDEPYGDETGPALFLLAERAGANLRVAMSGEGADELLLGYTRHFDIDELATIERFYRRWPPFLLKAAAPLFGGKRSNVLTTIAAHGPGAYFKAIASHIGWTLSDEEKSVFWRRHPMRPTRDLVSSWFTLPTSVPQLAQVQQADFQSWLVEDILMKSDKMGMAQSIEMRVPFLHLPLLEWCQRAPMELRLGHVKRGEFRPKAILRDFVAKRLPPEILNAPKRGFPVPSNRWFSEMLREQGTFLPVSRAIHEWIDFGALAPLIEAGKNGERAALAKLWGIAMLDRWFKVYVD